ncbi:MAG: hypothetical protein Phyf2KO_08890 [Phycisphaerales bacterium]
MAHASHNTLRTARRSYIVAVLTMLALYLSLFAFCDFVPTTNPSDRHWFPTTKMSLLYWKDTPDGISLKFTHQLGEAMLTNHDAYETVEYTRGYRQFPSDSSRLIAAMYYRDHWLSAKHFPADLHNLFNEAIASVTDEREAYYLRHCFEKATAGGRILWLGVLRNLTVLFLLVALAVSIVRSSRASTNLRAVKLALKKLECLCGYSLVGLTGEKCPECGRPVITPAQSSTTLDA